MKLTIPEIMHWFCNQRQTNRNIYSTKTQRIQVQNLENGCFNTVRLFYHAANCFEYFIIDDEGKKFRLTKVFFSIVCFWRREIVQMRNFFLVKLQYHGRSSTLEAISRYINMVFTGLFTIEALLKIFGFGVKVCWNNRNFRN